MSKETPEPGWLNANAQIAKMNSTNMQHTEEQYQAVSLALRAIINGEVKLSNKSNRMLSEHDPKVIAARRALGSEATEPVPMATIRDWDNKATNTQKHTPGQISVTSNDHLGLALVDKSGMTTIAQLPWQSEPEVLANANRLAHCWNCHDELVEALKAIDKLSCNCPLMSLEAQKLFEEIPAVKEYRIELAKVIVNMREQARSALSRAQGKVRGE